MVPFDPPSPIEMLLSIYFHTRFETVKQLPHPNSYINKCNYSVIIEYFVVESSSTSLVIKTQLFRVLVCLFGKGSGCFVTLLIPKILRDKLNQILSFHLMYRESRGTSSKGECFPRVFNNQ